MTKDEIIKLLDLSANIEGGYFRQTYCSDIEIDTDRVDAKRPVLTTIYYMLTDQEPIGHFHKNKSDIMHFFQGGSPLTYYIIAPTGVLTKKILGPDLRLGHELQFVVKGGSFKATRLEKGEYGLLGEAVAPGFNYHDMEFATPDTLQKLFPSLWCDEIAALTKPDLI